jgi:putative transposase
MTATYAINELCAALEVPRSSYYAHRRTQQHPGMRHQADAALELQIVSAFEQSGRTYGAPRIQYELRTAGRPVPARKRIARLMRGLGLNARPHRRYRVQTTDSNHSGPIALNRLLGRPVPCRLDEVWRSDITYVHTGEGWLYLCSFKDAYSRRQIGWAMSEHIDTPLVLNALHMATASRRPRPGLIVHTDRGSQYASAVYRAALDQIGAIPSMSRRANCYDNAAMESAWSSLKLERVYRENYATRAQARASIHDYL